MCCPRMQKRIVKGRASSAVLPRALSSCTIHLRRKSFRSAARFCASADEGRPADATPSLLVGASTLARLAGRCWAAPAETAAACLLVEAAFFGV